MRLFNPMLLGGVMTLMLAASGLTTAPEAAPKSPLAKPDPSAQTVPTTAQAGKVPTMTDFAPQITRLKNGLSVMIVEDARFPLVSTRLYVHAGSTYERPEEAGISHVLEHMVFKGTTQRPKGAVAREVEAAGGYLNAATSFDYTMYLTDMPARAWKLGMDVVRDMAFHPSLDAKELESEKDVIVAELQRGKDSPGSRLFQAIQADTLNGTPYDRPIIGYENTIRGLSVEKIRAYINDYYQPQSMLLLVVGDIKASEVLAEAERQFGGYANTEPVTAQASLSVESISHGAATMPSVVIQPGPWNKIYLAAALPVPGMDDVRTVPLDVLAHLLGGDQTSLFWRTYKYEKKLVDSISVSNLSFERLGVLYISAELDADKLMPFWQELTKDLATLTADRFTAQDIARAQLNLEDDLFRSKETLSGLASKLGHFQFFTGDGVMAERNMINSLRAVDHKQLQEAIDLWLKPGRLTTVMLPPKDSTSLPDATALRATLSSNWPAKTSIADTTATTTSSAQERIDLGQGRTLVLIPDATLPYISADLSYTGGDILLNADQQGLAALTARTLTRGTTSRSAPDMQLWLTDRAAGLKAGAGRQSFTVSLTSPTRFADDMLAMLHEVLQTPAFSAEEVEREKASQLASIRSQDDQPLGLAFRRLPAFLFPGSVYGYYQLGQPEQLAAYTADTVRSYWKAQRAQPWVLAVAGQFDRNAIIEAAKKLPAPDSKAATPHAPNWGKDHSLNLNLPGRSQAHYLMLFKTVPMDHPDAPGLDLLQTILDGQGGLLFRDLRDEKGLGYTVTAFNNSGPEYGYMAFYIGTEPSKISEAQEGFARVISKLHAELLPENEVARGKSQLEGDYYRNRQSLRSRSAEAASLTLLGKPLSFNRDTIDKAATLDAAALRDIATRYLKPDTAYIVQVLP